MWALLSRSVKEMKWCLFEYKYLPEFYFTSDIIKYMDRLCSFNLANGEKW